MRLEFWDLVTPIPDGTKYLYFKPGEEPQVTDAIKNVISNGFRIPLTILVKPNGEKQLGLIHAHIVGTSTNDFSWIKGTDFGNYEHPTRSILEYSTEIISGLREYSSGRVANAALELALLLNQINISQRTSAQKALLKASKFITKLTDECLAVLEHGSPFIHVRLIQDNKSWWEQIPQLVGFLASLSSDINRELGVASSSKGLTAIDSWSTLIQERLGRLSIIKKNPVKGVTIKTSIADSFLEASSYCAALAERYRLRKNNALAVLFLHRSADLCFIFLCARNNLIDWSVNGGRFDSRTYQRNGNDLSITLLKSVKYVDYMNLLSPKDKRAKDFEDLNTWRNQLLHAHYLSDIDDDTARDIFNKIRPHLEEIGGAEWKEARDCYLGGIRLNLPELLDIDTSLTRTFDIVDLAPI
jgi:hypothetical protein